MRQTIDTNRRDLANDEALLAVRWSKNAVVKEAVMKLDEAELTELVRAAVEAACDELEMIHTS